MAQFNWLIVLMLLLILPATVGADQKSQMEQESAKCGDCHNLPPLGKSGDGKFYAGAHLVHLKIQCDECHDSLGEPGHNNGIIGIRATLLYSHGPQVLWPSGGGGSCGGDKNVPMPTGCHGDIKEEKCFWMTGNVCKPASAP